MSVATIPVAFWLLPAGADAADLQVRIAELSRENGTPAFDAHVTLHVDTCSSDVDLESLVRGVAAASSPLALVAGATRHSAAYFKALYVDLAGHRGGPVADDAQAASLPALRRRLAVDLLRRGAGTADAAAPLAPAPVEQALARYLFLPHLSLLYGDLPLQLLQQLAARHDLRGRSILFDGIAAVRPSRGQADLSKVAHWEVVGAQRLGR